MAKQVFINLPVKDLAKSKTFYEALGFVNIPNFSDDKGIAMMWSDSIIFMLLTPEFYKKFIRNKEVINSQTTSGALIALSLDSKEAVKKFAETAKANGGEYYKVDMGVPEDMMFGYEVLDIDGNQFEPVWMSPDFNPRA